MWMMAVPVLSVKELSMKTSSVNFERDTPIILERTWRVGNVRHVVKFCFLRLDMSIIGNLIRDNSCKLQEQTMCLVQSVTKSVSQLLVLRDIWWCIRIKFYHLIHLIQREGRHICHICIKLCRSAAGLMSYLRADERKGSGGGVVGL